MAIYESTIRSETRMIDGVEIGRYSYAYKHSWSSGNIPGGSGRRVRVAESRGEDAQYKNRHVRHFIMADSFAEATQDGYYVFEIDRAPPLSCSELNGRVVGYLRREGRKLVLHAMPAMAEAA